MQLLTTPSLIPTSEQQAVTRWPITTHTHTHTLFYCSAWHHMVWDVPLVSWGHLSQLHPLPASCALPACMLARHGKLKNPWLSVSAAQQPLKHWYVANIILILNSKRNTMSATRKKMNSAPAKPKTLWRYAIKICIWVLYEVCFFFFL